MFLILARRASNIMFNTAGYRSIRDSLRLQSPTFVGKLDILTPHLEC